MILFSKVGDAFCLTQASLCGVWFGNGWFGRCDAGEYVKMAGKKGWLHHVLCVCVCVCAESSAELVLVYRASRLGWLSLVTGHHGRVVCFKNGTKEYCTMMCPRKGCLGTVFWVCTCQSYVGAISSYEYDSDVHNLTSILPYVLKSLMLWRCFVLEKKWSLCLVGPREFPNRNRAFEFGINSHMAVAKKLNHGTLQRTLQERYIYIYVHINLYLYYNDKIKYDRLLGGYQI